MPLAILKPGQRYVLVEARRRRAAFVREVRRTLELDNVEVLEGRAELPPAKHRHAAAVVLSRAVWADDSLPERRRGLARHRWTPLLDEIAEPSNGPASLCPRKRSFVTRSVATARECVEILKRVREGALFHVKQSKKDSLGRLLFHVKQTARPRISLCLEDLLWYAVGSAVSVVEVLVGRVLAVANQKGGVGKTTTSVNLSAGLALAGHSTLLIDLDPQASATSGLGVHPQEVEASIYHALIGEKPIDQIVRATQVQNLSLIPASRDLIGAEIELVPLPRREFRLQEAIAGLRRAVRLHHHRLSAARWVYSP